MPLCWRDDRAWPLRCSNYREYDVEGRNCGRAVQEGEGVMYRLQKENVRVWFQLEREEDYATLFNIYCSHDCFQYDKEDYDAFQTFNYTELWSRKAKWLGWTDQ